MTAPTFKSPGKQRVYDFIAAGMYASRDVIDARIAKSGSLGRFIQELVDGHHIDCIGNAEQAGRFDLPPHTRIFAVYGTPKLPPAPQKIQPKVEEAIRAGNPRKIKRNAQPGSGVIAGGWYVPPKTGSNYVERQDYRERAALAMLAR